MRRIFKIIPVVLLIVAVGGGTLVMALFRPVPSSRPQRSQPRSSQETKTKPTEPTKLMNIKSSAFGNKQSIPSKYTCDGKNVSPPLAISQVPGKAQSLALIVHDPDAPAGDWVHWTVWNIAPQTTEIAEDSVPEGAIEGITDFGKPGYGGPCPPSGSHRYFFELYALDTELDLAPSATKADIEQAMRGHILAQTQLMGAYERQ